MTTASKITMVRIALIPIFFLVMLLDFRGSGLMALIIFAVASVTDGVDGYIARRYNQVTDFGKFIDPLADKLLVMSALLIFVQWEQMPAWCAMLILAREFAVTGLRLIAVEGGLVIAAGISGKIKTGSSILCICLMLTSWHSICLGPAWLTVDNICVFVMVVTTLWSGAEYFIKNWHVLKLS